MSTIAKQKQDNLDVFMSTLDMKEQNIVQKLLLENEQQFEFNEKTGLYETKVKIPNMKQGSETYNQKQPLINNNTLQNQNQKIKDLSGKASSQFKQDIDITNAQFHQNQNKSTSQEQLQRQKQHKQSSRSATKSKNLYCSKSPNKNQSKSRFEGQVSKTQEKELISIQQELQQQFDLQQQQLKQQEEQSQYQQQQRVQLKFSARDFLQNKSKDQINQFIKVTQRQAPTYLGSNYLFNNQEAYNNTGIEEPISQLQGMNYNIINMIMSEPDHNDLSQEKQLYNLDLYKNKQDDQQYYISSEGLWNNNNQIDGEQFNNDISPILHNDVMHGMGSRDLLSYYRFILDNAKKQSVQYSISKKQFQEKQLDEERLQSQSNQNKNLQNQNYQNQNIQYQNKIQSSQTLKSQQQLQNQQQQKQQQINRDQIQQQNQLSQTKINTQRTKKATIFNN